MITKTGELHMYLILQYFSFLIIVNNCVKYMDDSYRYIQLCM